ncbi:MAG: hypothetical protein ACM3QW_06080, partial [Ignavibacteriales bacterium]
ISFCFEDQWPFLGREEYLTMPLSSLSRPFDLPLFSPSGPYLFGSASLPLSCFFLPVLAYRVFFKISGRFLGREEYLTMLSAFSQLFR